MSTIFYREIDRGLKSTIEELIDVEDLVVRPRQSGHQQDIVFPSVTFFSYDRSHDTIVRREGGVRGKIVDEIDEEEGTITMIKPIIHYHLFYQVDFWARRMTTINRMLREWDSKVERFDLLEVPILDEEHNPTGETEKTFFEEVDYAENDYTKNKERRFHRVYTYKIDAKIDVEEKEKYPIVADREIERHNLDEGG